MRLSAISVIATLIFVDAGGISISRGDPVSKSIDFYVNFPSRVTDFLLGNNTQHWANTSVIISNHTRTIYQCCNGFLLGADGKMQHSSTNNSWGQAPYIDAGRKVVINIDPQTSTNVSAAAVCEAAFNRKEDFTNELLSIAKVERISGFTLDWEDATGNDVACFNKLWSFVSARIEAHDLTMSVSIDDSNHQGPMDMNSTDPYSTEWDWLGYVSWTTGALVNMGTYPGGWSKGLSYPAASYLEAVPCPKYPEKMCGLKGQVLNMLQQNVSAAYGQLSPGISPGVCSPDNSTTTNGWTQPALKSFLDFCTEHEVRSVTLWFANALQLYQDSSTCPWFIPTLLDWAES